MAASDVRLFEELKRQVVALGAFTEQLLEEHAALAVEHTALSARVAALEAASAAECGTCASRRASDAERQRRLRRRHATEAEPV